jgi:hypothetical protein
MDGSEACACYNILYGSKRLESVGFGHCRNTLYDICAIVQSKHFSVFPNSSAGHFYQTKITVVPHGKTEHPYKPQSQSIL